MPVNGDGAHAADAAEPKGKRLNPIKGAAVPTQPWTGEDARLSTSKGRRGKPRLYRKIVLGLELGTGNWVLLYPPCFNSVSTCRAISLSVSNTPTPWKATASTTGSFFLRSSRESASTGRIFGRSRLFSCRT